VKPKEQPRWTRPRLAIRTETDPAPRHQLLAVTGSCVIGVDDRCDLVLEDAWASSRHAEIITRHGAARVEDCGSTNGTYVNRRRIHGSHPLRHRDTVRIGDTFLVVELEQFSRPTPERDIPPAKLPDRLWGVAQALVVVYWRFGGDLSSLKRSVINEHVAVELDRSDRTARALLDRLANHYHVSQLLRGSHRVQAVAEIVADKR
jgi:FHA domain